MVPRMVPIWLRNWFGRDRLARAVPSFCVFLQNPDAYPWNCAMTKPLVVNCPNCASPLEWTAEARFRPFCSERCKMSDLGAWATEKFRVPVAPDLHDPDDVPTTE